MSKKQKQIMLISRSLEVPPAMLIRLSRAGVIPMFVDDPSQVRFLHPSLPVPRDDALLRLAMKAISKATYSDVREKLGILIAEHFSALTAPEPDA